MKWIDLALREKPKQGTAVRYKTALCGLLDRVEEGRKCVRDLLELHPGTSIRSLIGYYTSAPTTKLRSLVVEGLRKAGLPEE